MKTKADGFFGNVDRYCDIARVPVYPKSLRAETFGRLSSRFVSFHVVYCVSSAMLFIFRPC